MATVEELFETACSWTGWALAPTQHDPGPLDAPVYEPPAALMTARTIPA